MGRRLTYSERAARRSQEDRERRRRAREAEERREERAKKRERERQRALNAAQEEFNEWQETEDALATLAAPKRSVRGTEARLMTGLSRHSFEPGQFVPEVFDARRFVPETFSPAPACNFDEPVGPLAAVVEPIRAAALAKCAEKVKAEPGPGPALEKVASGGGACCVALIVLRTRAGGALFTGVGGWLTVGVVAAASLVIAILAASMKSSRKARVWERIRADASAHAEMVYRDAEAARLNDFESRQASARKQFEAAESFRLADFQSRQAEARREFETAESARRADFEKEENARIAWIQGLLDGEIGVLKRALDRRIAKTRKALPVSCSVTGRVRSRTSVEIAFLAPDMEDLPQQVARLTKSGVSYRDKNDRELDNQYWLVVHGVALRYASEIMSRCPTVVEVRLDAYEERIDEAKGKPCLACILAHIAPRSGLSKIESWENIKPDVVIEESGGGSAWKRGEFVEQDPVTTLEIVDSNDFEKTAADWPDAVDASADGALDISGTWVTEYLYEDEPTKATIEFEQEDGAVAGRYGKKATIRGELAGRRLRGKWQEGTDKGELVLTFSDDGSRFEGTWGTGLSGADGGSWKGERK
jgi:hypothetical protein